MAFEEAMQRIIDPIDQFSITTISKNQHKIGLSSLGKFNVNDLIIKSYNNILSL